ncbi:MAG TPA: hypothetical protein VHR15_09810 [Ktedonobacterales bacterium]|jgi:hypothetical protein|nr:hypothetical protein [Ktedonobacterales bacterium]
MTIQHQGADNRQGDWIAQMDASWLHIGAEWDEPEWLRTTIVPAREPLLFLLWIEERTLLARQEELRAVGGACGLVGALKALTPEERDDWLNYRKRLAWRLGERFEPSAPAEELYRSWGFAF